MSTYTPVYHKIWNPLDDVGAMYSFVRFNGELVYEYRRRLLLEARDKSGPTQKQFISTINRQLAQYDVPVFKITLKTDVDNNPLAEDPFISITSTYLYVYHDYDNDLLDFSTQLSGVENSILLSDVYALFTASTYFDIEAIDEDYADRLSINLKFSDTAGYRENEILLQSREVKLKYPLVKALYPERSPYFLNEVLDLASIVDDGDFYIDYLQGVIFFHSYPSGTVSYAYRDFPFVMYWQPIKAWPYNDPDKKYAFKDAIVADDTGLDDLVLINTDEASVINTLQKVHPLTWGE